MIPPCEGSDIQLMGKVVDSFTHNFRWRGGHDSLGEPSLHVLLAFLVWDSAPCQVVIQCMPFYRRVVKNGLISSQPGMHFHMLVHTYILWHCVAIKNSCIYINLKTKAAPGGC